MNLKLRMLLSALATWFVPFFISFFMVDMNTRAYLPNPLVFKIVMILSSAATTFFVMKKLKPYHKRPWYFASLFFLVINSLLDMLILIPISGMPLTEWATTVLPSYLVVFFTLGFFVLK